MPGYDVMNGMASAGLVVLLLGAGLVAIVGALLNRRR